MTRLIERWFPCKEVSENSRSGWGSGNAERELFTWFASRPLAQAKAAVICSLLPWPKEPSEQERIQDMVRRAMKCYDANHNEIVAELKKHYPDGGTLLDSFSGRAMIPLEAARLGIKTWGIDYSPVATLAGTLLADYPMRDWSQEELLPFDGYSSGSIDQLASSRLLYDVEYILNMIGNRYEAEMDPFYPKVNGKRPWGYLWAITLPCVNCGNRFPLTSNLGLRTPKRTTNPNKKDDPGQSYYIEKDEPSGDFRAIVHEGPPRFDPTLAKKPKTKGRVAICLFCDHVHDHKVHTRLMGDGQAEDVLLVVADICGKFGKLYREPVQKEMQIIQSVAHALNAEKSFSPGLPAVPDEKAFGSTGPRDYVRYGYHSYGDFSNSRQILGLVKIARIVNKLGEELLAANISPSYVAALSGYAGSVFIRMMRRTTRGAKLQVISQKGSDIFATGPPVPFGYDYFEAGCGQGPGTWNSVARSTIRVLRKQLDRVSGIPAHIQQGTSVALPFLDDSLDAVVTDPPYDAMVEFSDASDIFYVWLKRALVVSHPDFGITSNSMGLQDKTDEAVVKMTWKRSGDHRTPEHYYKNVVMSLTEISRVLKPDGVVTIMFGHDDPDAWKRFLTALDDAGLILTGSWPARTEKGSQLNKANIETTLTLACRPSDHTRPVGYMMNVDSQVRQAILERIPLWQRAGLVLQDQRMASYGPAMEVVGRYSEIRDKAGRLVSLTDILAKARRYVEEAAEVKIGEYSIGEFDIRTQFGLFWVHLYGRSIVPGAEVRWLRLGWDLTDDSTAGLLIKDKRGLRLIYAEEAKVKPEPESTVIDIAFAIAATGKSITDVANILSMTERIEDDYLWETMSYLVKQVSEQDSDGDVWTWVVRNRNIITGISQDIQEDILHKQKITEDAGIQQGML